MNNKKVLLIQNITGESGGLVEDVLKEKNMQFDIANLADGMILLATGEILQKSGCKDRQ